VSPVSNNGGLIGVQKNRSRRVLKRRACFQTEQLRCLLGIYLEVQSFHVYLSGRAECDAFATGTFAIVDSSTGTTSYQLDRV